MKHKEFISKVASAVIAHAPKYDVKVVSPIIAQAILESGWGSSSMTKYNNLFGMKCGSKWTGKSVNKETKEEYTKGKITVIRDNFRVYDTFSDGINGYFEFLFKGRTRYNNLKGVTSPLTYVTNLVKDGYATDSKYISKIMKIINDNNLEEYDKQLNKHKISTKSSSSQYYKKYTGKSTNIDTVFRSIGVPSKYIKDESSESAVVRKPVALKNGIKEYSGTSDQNIKLINLAKSGKLKKV